MKRTLNILELNASGRLGDSVSRMLSAEVVGALEERHANAAIVHRDLAAGIGFVNNAWIDQVPTHSFSRPARRPRGLTHDLNPNPHPPTQRPLEITMNDQTPSAATVATAATLLRLALGIMFIAHALLKIMVFTLPGTAGFFESVGFPGALAYVVTFAELAGGVLLVAGVAVRSVNLALLPVLLGATYVHFGAGWVFSNENGGWEYPAFLVVAAIVSALLGSGRFALRLPSPLRATEPEPSAG